MEIEEAVSIIEEMIQSLKNNPNQFHININVTGQHITSHGGTGLSITTTGGGPGSTTIGEIVSARGGMFGFHKNAGNKQRMRNSMLYFKH